MAASAPSSATRRPGGSASGRQAAPRRELIEIFVVSFAGLLLEISYTRVISFKLFYYYIYLIIGLALLGIGTGGVAVAVSARLRRAPLPAVIGWASALGALGVAAGYLVVAETDLTTLDIWAYGEGRSFENLARLLLICLALFAPFAMVGLMFATWFGRRTESIGRYYFADLVGAGLACAVVVFLIRDLGQRRPPPDGRLHPRRRPLVPGALRDRVRPGLVPRPGQLRGGQRRQLGGVRAAGELPVHRRRGRGQLDQLTDDGILAAQFGEVDYEGKPNRTARYLSTVRRALDRIGIDDRPATSWSRPAPPSWAGRWCRPSWSRPRPSPTTRWQPSPTSRPR